MNLLNLEKILQNPDTELKAQIQNQMREEQLKQAIEDTLSNYNEPESRLYLFNKGIVEALQNPNLLRHCDPEIMKQAGWVREEDVTNSIKLRISQLKLRESELLWNIHDMPFQSYAAQERNRRELDKIMFTRNEMELFLSEYIQPPKQ